MARWLAVTALAFLVLGTARAQTGENPFRTAKVGDWARYKMTTRAKGLDFDVEVMQKVTARDAKFVTLSTTNKLKDKEFPGKEEKIDLSKPYNPAAAKGAKEKAKVEKIDEGAEKITVAGKSHACKRTKFKVTTTDQKVSQVTIWVSPALPLSGMAKLEIKGSNAEILFELLESGRGQ